MWLWLFISAAAAALAAPSAAERKDFDSATWAYTGHDWERADRELGAFRAKYPKSEFLAEAQLFQAEARVNLGNYDGAIELLNVGPEITGRFADEYLFWMARAQSQKGEKAAAADAYARFTSDYPNSSRLLDAIVAEADLRALLKQWSRVVDLLSQPDGRFQQLAKANPAQAASVRGRFLLAEAFFAQDQREAAAQALEPLAGQPLEPQLAWQRDFLRAKILLAQDQPDQALALTTNLAMLAANLPALSAEGNALQARIFQELGQPENAVAAWRLNLAATIPVERQREALLHVGDLLIAQNRLTEASQILETFLTTGTNVATADIAMMTLGELRLRTAVETNWAVSTNFLSDALTAYNTVLANHPGSKYTGRVQLGRGWCYWLLGRTAESATAFQAAANALPTSYDQAVARFKLGDALAKQQKYAEALRNYKLVADNAAGLETVRIVLLERALYQVVRMARELGDAATANGAMAELLGRFPNGFLAERSLMSLGPETSQTADPAAAREVFAGFTNSSPDSTLIPEVELAIARTYEQEQDWTNALAAYDSWLEQFTNNPARPRAEYYKALTTARAGDTEQALTLFTNYVSRFPTNDFTPLALWWTADHYLQQEDLVSAETYYQLLFKNHPESSLRYDAQLMAGRAAFERRPEEAVVYFTNLTSDAKCPTNILAQAYFAYGDTLMSLQAADTNSAYANLVEAGRVFSKLIRLNPETRIATLAQGKIGDCYLQLAATDPTNALANYSIASNAYSGVLLSTNAALQDREQAEVGLGLVLEKSAKLFNGTNGPALARRALDHYLNVVYGKTREADEQPDMTWVSKAGLEALRLTESLQSWDQVARLCDTLSDLIPSMKPQLEKRRARAEEQLRKLSN